MRISYISPGHCIPNAVFCQLKCQHSCLYLALWVLVFLLMFQEGNQKGNFGTNHSRFQKKREVTSRTLNEAFHLFVSHLWKGPYFSGFWNNSLGLLAPLKLGSIHKGPKTMKSLCHYHDSWNILCDTTNIYLMAPDRFFIQIPPVSILEIPCMNVVPGVFCCHHSAPRLPFCIVQSTKASCSYYNIFLFQINTEIFS